MAGEISIDIFGNVIPWAGTLETGEFRNKVSEYVFGMTLLYHSIFTSNDYYTRFSLLVMFELLY